MPTGKKVWPKKLAPKAAPKTDPKNWLQKLQNWHSKLVPNICPISLIINLFICDYITLGSSRSEFRPQAQFEAAYITRVGASHASIVFFDVTPILTRTILLLLIVFCTNT